jgi:hypothetical protein
VVATAVPSCTCSASFMGEPAKARTLNSDELVGWDCQDVRRAARRRGHGT